MYCEMKCLFGFCPPFSGNSSIKKKYMTMIMKWSIYYSVFFHCYFLLPSMISILYTVFLSFLGYEAPLCASGAPIN